MHMLHMLRFILRINENVVKICDDKNIQIFSERIVDQFLTCRWGVRELERHDRILVKFISSSKNYHLFLLFFDAYQIVYSSKIYFDEDFGFLQSVLQFADVE